MKVAEVVATFPPYFGGMGNACLRLSVGLAALGNAVDVYTARVPGGEVDDPDGVTVHRLRAQLQFGNAPLLLGLFGISDADVIHLHYPFYSGAEIIYLLSRVRQIPYVVTYHMDTVGTGWRAHLFDWHRKVALAPLMTGARQIYVSSLDYAQHSYLSEIRSIWDKVLEVPLGVDTSRFSPTTPSADIGGLLGLSPGDRVVMFIGQLDKPHYFKGVPVLLHAFSGIGDPDVKLVIVGDGELRPAFAAQAVSLGIADRVVFAGSVDDALLNDFLSLSEFTVQPSTDRTEAFGMALLEAQAAGRAVVASNLPGVRTVVRDGIDGLLCQPNDPRDLRNKIRYLLDNRSVSQAFGTNGREKVVADYSWETIALQLNRHLIAAATGAS